jgi:hypothetical protein
MTEGEIRKAIKEALIEWATTPNMTKTLEDILVGKLVEKNA